jgi:membrane protein YdbS with pleckstrin-like domain
MGFTEILTIIFVLLKVFGVITCSWWLVFLPEIIAVALYVVTLILAITGVNKTSKHIKKHFDNF